MKTRPTKIILALVFILGGSACTPQTPTHHPPTSTAPPTASNTRPVDAACDIGAYEYSAPLAFGNSHSDGTPLTFGNSHSDGTPLAFGNSHSDGTALAFGNSHSDGTALAFGNSHSDGTASSTIQTSPQIAGSGQTGGN